MLHEISGRLEPHDFPAGTVVQLERIGYAILLEDGRLLMAHGDHERARSNDRSTFTLARAEARSAGENQPRNTPSSSTPTTASGCRRSITATTSSNGVDTGNRSTSESITSRQTLARKSVPLSTSRRR